MAARKSFRLGRAGGGDWLAEMVRTIVSTEDLHALDVTVEAAGLAISKNFFPVIKKHIALTLQYDGDSFEGALVDDITQGEGPISSLELLQKVQEASQTIKELVGSMLCMRFSPFYANTSTRINASPFFLRVLTRLFSKGLGFRFRLRQLYESQVESALCLWAAQTGTLTMQSEKMEELQSSLAQANEYLEKVESVKEDAMVAAEKCKKLHLTPEAKKEEERFPTSNKAFLEQLRSELREEVALELAEQATAASLTTEVKEVQTNAVELEAPPPAPLAEAVQQQQAQLELQQKQQQELIQQQQEQLEQQKEQLLTLQEQLQREQQQHQQEQVQQQQPSGVDGSCSEEAEEHNQLSRRLGRQDRELLNACIDEVRNLTTILAERTGTLTTTNASPGSEGARLSACAVAGEGETGGEQVGVVYEHLPLSRLRLNPICRSSPQTRIDIGTTMSPRGIRLHTRAAHHGYTYRGELTDDRLFSSVPWFIPPPSSRGPTAKESASSSRASFAVDTTMLHGGASQQQTFVNTHLMSAAFPDEQLAASQPSEQLAASQESLAASLSAGEEASSVSSAVRGTDRPGILSHGKNKAKPQISFALAPIPACNPTDNRAPSFPRSDPLEPVPGKRPDAATPAAAAGGVDQQPSAETITSAGSPGEGHAGSTVEKVPSVVFSGEEVAARSGRVKDEQLRSDLEPNSEGQQKAAMDGEQLIKRASLAPFLTSRVLSSASSAAAKASNRHADVAMATTTPQPAAAPRGPQPADERAVARDTEVQHEQLQLQQQQEQQQEDACSKAALGAHQLQQQKQNQQQQQQQQQQQSQQQSQQQQQFLVDLDFPRECPCRPPEAIFGCQLPAIWPVVTGGSTWRKSHEPRSIPLAPFKRQAKEPEATAAAAAAAAGPSVALTPCDAISRTKQTPQSPQKQPSGAGPYMQTPGGPDSSAMVYTPLKGSKLGPVKQQLKREERGLQQADAYKTLHDLRIRNQVLETQVLGLSVALGSLLRASRRRALFEHA
ncbi:hypothetical protein Esti_005039 [Eimeria stiedai]